MDDPTLDETLATRAARWFQPSPAELVGLAILLLGAVAASGLLWLQATQRPATLTDGAGMAGVAVAADGTTDGPAPGVTAPPGAASGTTPDHAGDHGDGSVPGGGTGGAAGAGVEPGGVPAGVVTVHVTGAVAVPGLVVIPGPGRVGDAVAAAGGMTTEAVAERINLARVLVDGEHVHVPRDGEEVVPPAGATAGTGAGVTGASVGITADGRVDINRATAAELETLPGVGPSRAEAIIGHRDEHGPFGVPGDLRGVPGIGEVTFQRLAERIAVG